MDAAGRACPRAKRRGAGCYMLTHRAGRLRKLRRASSSLLRVTPPSLIGRAVYQRGFFGWTGSQGRPDQHGRQGALSGQHLHRATVAEPEIRRNIPEGLRLAGGGANWDRQVADLL